MTKNPANPPTVIDEAHMEQFSNDQLAYKAWIGTDLVAEILLDDAACDDAMSDAKFEAAHAAMALRVLVRRLTGMDAEALRAAVKQRQLEVYVLGEGAPAHPAGETLQ